MEANPCPCCGHLTLPGEPGDYEVCPVCSWEDDRTQLRWPMSDDGANGISLMEAQGRFVSENSLARAGRRDVRRPRADEPVDAGWRPFDPAVDWTHPVLDSERWPRDRSTLYYWRSTYWNGDPGPMPDPPAEPTGGDLLVQHLRREVPEAGPVIEAVEWQYGVASPMQVARRLADVVGTAYGARDTALGPRVATALAPGLDERSEMYAPNVVGIGFCEKEHWDDPAIRPFVDRWPGPVGARMRSQRARRRDNDAEMERSAAVWADLWCTAAGQPVEVVEARLRALTPQHAGNPRSELHVVLGARVMSDPRWLVRHPWAGLRLAWRFRDVQSPARTLRWLLRPRFAG